MRTENDQLIVEAPTAEAALELVAEQLGTHARIAGVERVRRGGLGGFFARELVQVTATAQDMADDADPQPDPVQVQAEPEPVTDAAADAPVDRLLRELAQRDDPFAATLQRQLVPAAQGEGERQRAGGWGSQGEGERQRAGGWGSQGEGERQRAGGPTPSAASIPYAGAAPPSWSAAAEQALRRPFTLPGAPGTALLGVPAAPGAPGTAAGARPVAEPAPAPLPGTPQWTVRNLCRLGLPPLLSAEDAASLPSHDDVAWTHVLADRLRPLCGPLPDGRTIVVGPPAERLAGTLDLAICWPGQQTPPESFVAPISGSYSEREWLASVRSGRHLHLVVGGPRWRGLLYDDPAVLSHDDTTMCEAISLAFGLGIRLGYTCHPSGELTRTNPIDLAVAIRRLLPTHR